MKLFRKDLCLTFFLVLLPIYVILYTASVDNWENFQVNGRSALFLEKYDNFRRDLKHPKIFCIILTKLKNLDTKAKTVYSAWGHKCTDYRFISLVPGHNLTDKRIDTVHDNMFKLLKPTGLYNDTYSNLTNKVLLAFEDAYKLRPDFDWYLKADDDTFIFYDNLRDFVETKEPSDPVTFGYDFKVIVDKGYHSGGAGYLLSHEAVKRLMLKWRTSTYGGTEDVEVARILRAVNVYPSKSLDDKGRERFHPLSIGSHYNAGFPRWMYDYASNPIKNGSDCCSETSISFHYTGPHDINKISLYLAERKQKNNNTYAPLNIHELYKYLYENG